MTKKLTPVVEAPTTSKMAGIYNEPSKPAVRLGADNHLKYPSRMGSPCSTRTAERRS